MRCARLLVRYTRTLVRRHTPSDVLRSIVSFVSWQLSDHIFSCCEWNQPPGDGSVVSGTVELQMRKLMAAGRQVSLDTILSRLLAALIPGQLVLA